MIEPLLPAVMRYENGAPAHAVNVVVMAAVPLNEYYDRPYDLAKPTAPACYACGDPTADDPEQGMAPKDVEDKQSDTCEGCWANAKGSSGDGWGTACNKVRRLLVMLAGDLDNPSTIREAELRSLSVPQASAENWAQYVAQVLLGKLSRPYFGVVTTVSARTGIRGQLEVRFEFQQLINFDQETWDAIKEKHAEALRAITAPYPIQFDLDAAARASRQEEGGP